MGFQNLGFLWRAIYIYNVFNLFKSRNIATDIFVARTIKFKIKFQSQFPEEAGIIRKYTIIKFSLSIFICLQAIANSWFQILHALFTLICIYTFNRFLDEVFFNSSATTTLLCDKWLVRWFTCGRDSTWKIRLTALLL